MGRFKRPTEVSSFRKMAAVSWDPPRDPTIYGDTEVRVDKLLAYLQQIREQTGGRVTVTHALARAFAVLLRRHPGLNACIRRGRIWQREQVDVFIQVAVPPEGGSGLQGADLSGAVIRNADTKTTAQISADLRAKAERIRKRDDPMLAATKRNLAWMPPWLMGWMLRLVSYLSHDWGISLKAFGIPDDPFGSVLVTSVGMFGIKNAYAPLFPGAKNLGIVLVGQMSDAPVVEDQKVTIGKILPVTMTLDHRVVDGLQAAVIAREVVSMLEDPEQLDAELAEHPSP